MTVAEWCLFGAALLPLLTLAPTKALAPREFDNANPRDLSFYEQPIRKRALGAHSNGFEVFPFFAVAVLLAELKHSPQHWLDGLAIAFLSIRVAYVVAYVADRPTLRTTLWNVAFACNVGIFFLSGFGVPGAVVAMLLGICFAAAVWGVLIFGPARD